MSIWDDGHSIQMTEKTVGFIWKYAFGDDLDMDILKMKISQECNVNLKFSFKSSAAIVLCGSELNIHKSVFDLCGPLKNFCMTTVQDSLIHAELSDKKDRDVTISRIMPLKFHEVGYCLEGYILEYSIEHSESFNNVIKSVISRSIAIKGG